MEKGFFASLFDLSFSNFVTPKLIKVLFILLLAVFGLFYLLIGIGIADSSEGSTAPILWFIIIGPLLVLLYTLFYRVILELIMVIFRIYETTQEQLEITRQRNP